MWNFRVSYFIQPQIALFSGVSFPLYYSDNNKYYELVSESRNLFGYGGINFRRIIGSNAGLSVFVYDSDFNVEITFDMLLRIGLNASKGSFYVYFWNYGF